MVGGMVNTYPQWKDKEYIERIKMDKTAVVTIKLTEFELEKIIYSISKYIETIETEKNGGLNIPDLEPEYYTLKKELRNIRKWINEEKHKAEVDKKKEQELIIGKATCKECPEE